MCVYGNLIEIVGTAPLQRDQLFYGCKVDVQGIYPFRAIFRI